MAQLSEKDLALLSALAYCDYIVTKQKPLTRLGEAINNLLELIGDTNEPISKDGRNKLKEIGITGDFNYVRSHPSEEGMGDQEALELLKKVLLEAKKSDSLMNLTIASYIENDKTVSGITAACFVDDDGDATVAFRGTDGSYKVWYDNFEGAGNTIATPMQESAQKFIESLPAYEHLTVTGHSKGGNLSAYVAILCDQVDRAVSFDGQGFSESFEVKYKDQIAERQGKVKTIAANNDIVNTLLMSIGETFYVETDGTGLQEAHFMTKLILQGKFDDEGNYTDFVEQGSEADIINIVADTFAQMLPAYEEEIFTDFAGPLLSYWLGQNEIYRDDIIKMVIQSIIPLIGMILMHRIFIRLIIGRIAVLVSEALILNAVDYLFPQADLLQEDEPFSLFLPIAELLGFPQVFQDIIAGMEFGFAEGGFPAHNHIFVAREAGPELVGTLNGRTAVANRAEITQAVSIGVYNAFASAINHDSPEDPPAVARVFLDGRLLATARQV